MSLYSYKGAYPTQLPKRLKFSNGLTKTDPSTFTAEDIQNAGWITVDYPPVVDYPNKLEWNSETLQWTVRPPNEAETAFRWQHIRQECERRLLDTDYKVIKAMELGEPVDPVYVAYRQALRDLYNNVNDVDPWVFQYPTLQFNDEETIETANTP